MKIYSLIGKKLIESTPDELIASSVGVVIDDQEQIIRLIVTPNIRKMQRENLVQLSTDLNKNEYAGTYLVSHLENPVIIKSYLEEIKKIQKGQAVIAESKKAPLKEPIVKKGKKKKGLETEMESSIDNQILQRWNPEIVKKVVSFLDGKISISLQEIQNTLETTEGEAYWLTQDLIHLGIIPGRWIGYSDGTWVYQVISEQPLNKTIPDVKEEKETSTSKKEKSPQKADKKSQTKKMPKKN